MKKIIFASFYVIISVLLQAQTMGYQTLSQLKESPAGANIVLFFNTINNGEKLTEEHAKQLFSAELLEKRSAKELLLLLNDVRGTDGQLELYDANRVETFKYETKAKGLKHGDWLDMPFTLEAQAPYKIKGIGVSTTRKKPNADSPMLRPDKKRDFKPAPKNYASFEDIAQKADELAQAYQDMNWFEGVILVAKDGKPFYQKAFGWANRTHKIPNTIDTKFRIGSINKSFTATLVMQMVEKGKLSYFDKLEKFDLGFPPSIASKVEVRHLLNHTAGFSDIFIPQYIDNVRDYKDIDDIMPLLLNEPLLFEPGEDQRYSNYGYIVLGAILEKLSGQKFGDLLQENILNPLDLKNTHYNIAENIEGEAQSYRFELDGSKVDHTSQLEYCTPDGGMYSTAADLLTYYQNWFYTEKLMSNKTKLFRANNFKHSKGNWDKMIKQADGGMGEAGGGPGVSTLVEMLLKENYTVIVLANTDHSIAEKLGLKLMSFIQGYSDAAPRLPVTHFAMQQLDEKGTDYIKANFETVLKEAGYSPNSSVLNNIGYRLMRFNQMEEAIEIFKLNVTLYPDEANPYDSLAEAYYKNGDWKKAKMYCEKALERDETFLNSKKRLEKINQKLDKQ